MTDPTSLNAFAAEEEHKMSQGLEPQLRLVRTGMDGHKIQGELRLTGRTPGTVTATPQVWFALEALLGKAGPVESGQVDYD